MHTRSTFRTILQCSPSIVVHRLKCNPDTLQVYITPNSQILSEITKIPGTSQGSIRILIEYLMSSLEFNLKFFSAFEMDPTCSCNSATLKNFSTDNSIYFITCKSLVSSGRCALLFPSSHATMPAPSLPHHSLHLQ